MKKSFFGYYRPNNDEFSELWKNCVFILDTNVLLDLFRYPKEARDDLIKVLRLISERLWIPYQAALEYQENRLAVIAEQVKKYEDVKKVLTENQNQLGTNLGHLQLKKRHSTIDPEDFLEKIGNAFKEFQSELEEFKKMQPDVFNDNKLGDEVDTLLEGKVGLPPESQDELDKIYKEGDIRFSQERPPGYMDKGKSKENKRRTYSYGGLVYKREYGDWILWSQIIKEAETRNLKYIIFVTSDEKEDWWWFIESGGKKTIGPRPELVEEIRSKAGVSLFYMYNTERFLEFAKKYLKIQIKQESINQARDIAQNMQEISQGTLPAIGGLAERVVQDWLTSSLSDNEFITLNIGHLDFIVENIQNKTKVGYEVKYIREPQALPFKQLLDEAMREGYYEVKKGKLSKFTIVVVVDKQSKTDEINSILEDPKIIVPEGTSLVVGFLTTNIPGVSQPYIFIKSFEYYSFEYDSVRPRVHVHRPPPGY